MGATEDLFKDEAPTVYVSRKEKVTEEVFDPNGNILRRVVTETEEEETRPFEPAQQASQPDWSQYRIGDPMPLTPVTVGPNTQPVSYGIVDSGR